MSSSTYMIDAYHFLLIGKPQRNWFICIENLIWMFTLLNFLSDPTHPGSNWFSLFLFHQKNSKHSCSIWYEIWCFKKHVVLARKHIIVWYFDNLDSFCDGNGIFWHWESIPCLLMPCWFQSHQSTNIHHIGYVGQTTCIFSVVPEVVWSTWVMTHQRYDSKCEYIFCNLSNNSACWELRWC